MTFPARPIFPGGLIWTILSLGENTQLPTSLGWKDAFVLFCNRSWEPQYGVDLVVQAFVQASQADSNLRLLLLGSGSQAELIRGILQNGGVLDKVHMPGQISYKELPDYYRAADVYLSASHTDGSSVSLMEALACGLPAIGFGYPRQPGMGFRRRSRLDLHGWGWSQTG